MSAFSSTMLGINRHQELLKQLHCSCAALVAMWVSCLFLRRAAKQQVAPAQRMPRASQFMCHRMWFAEGHQNQKELFQGHHTRSPATCTCFIINSPHTQATCTSKALQVCVAPCGAATVATSNNPNTRYCAPAAVPPQQAAHMLRRTCCTHVLITENLCSCKPVIGSLVPSESTHKWMHAQQAKANASQLEHDTA